ncbi:hypothetical protein TKK_0017640 [Trichogramma kaykai]
MLLQSLPASYENFRCAIESRDILPDLEILKIKVLEEYRSRHRTSDDCHNSAMLAKTKHTYSRTAGGSTFQPADQRRITEAEAKLQVWILQKETAQGS